MIIKQTSTRDDTTAMQLDTPVQPSSLMIDEKTSENDSVNKELDYWEYTSGKVIRHHVRLRETMFDPGEVRDGPDRLHLEDKRITLANFEDGEQVSREDSWTNPLQRTMILKMEKKWEGTTTLFDKPKFPQLLVDDSTENASTPKGTSDSTGTNRS